EAPVQIPRGRRARLRASVELWHRNGPYPSDEPRVEPRLITRRSPALRHLRQERSVPLLVKTDAERKVLARMVLPKSPSGDAVCHLTAMGGTAALPTTREADRIVSFP